MPDPLHRLHEEVGMWGPTDLPTKPQLAVLKHLSSNGEPRLYVTKDGASLTNSESAAGWSIKCDLNRLLRGVMPAKFAPWIELDQEETLRAERRDSSPKVYKISRAGREAVAQYYARQRYEEESLELAKKILLQCRVAHNAYSLG